ncbi:MAG: hypothetical protein ACKOAH_03915, partial [Pirellula sp.]
MYSSHALMLLVSMVGACAVFSQEPDKTAPNVVAIEPGVKVTLLAEHPDLVTPTGIDLDPDGNLWVVACQTQVWSYHIASPIIAMALRARGTGNMEENS